MAFGVYLLIGKLNIIVLILFAGIIYLFCLYLFKGLSFVIPAVARPGR